jgi:class 3 adenylate cyclase
MSDVEASSRHWAEAPGEMASAVRTLDDVVTAAVESNGGTVLKPRGEGDSHFAVFALPSSAVRAACRVQEGSSSLRVRIGVHAGEGEPAVDDYYGVAVNQAARLRSVASGGQTLLSSVVATLARSALRPDVRLKSLGHHRIRDFPALEEVFQACSAGTDAAFPPLDTGESRAPAILTVVLVDVCNASGHVATTARGDVITWQRKLASSLRRTAEPREPAVLRLLGDGCLAAFDDPVVALDFLHDVRTAAAEDELQLRCGVEVGRVALDDGDVVGPAVFVAAELCRRAGADQILGSATFADLAGASATAERIGSTTLRATGTEVDVVSL